MEICFDYQTNKFLTDFKLRKTRGTIWSCSVRPSKMNKPHTVWLPTRGPDMNKCETVQTRKKKWLYL